jgi:hypothetical protein
MCNCNIFRTLNADEIEVRIQQVVEGGGKIKAVLLLYKNARVDMDMLDEHFGCFGWQREHSFKDGKNYCKVSVYDRGAQRWVSKEDVGIESNTEETKGEASDAFKRACVNFGIGRELYTAPSIVLELNQNEVYQAGLNKANKPLYRTLGWVRFRVGHIAYNAEKRTIESLNIVDSNGRVRYTYKAEHKAQPNETRPDEHKSHFKPIEPKKLTIDNLLDEEYLNGLCNFLRKKAVGKKLDDVIRTYYDCDEEVISHITNEYLRQYDNPAA